MKNNFNDYEDSANHLQERSSTDDWAANLMAVLKRRKELVAISCILGSVLGLAYYFFLPPAYESRAEILLMQNDYRSTSSDPTSTENVTEELLATHMKIIQSKRIVSKALEIDKLVDLPSIQQMGETRSQMIDAVVENLFITSGGAGAARNAHVLNLGFKHSHPEDAQRVLQAIIDEYQKFVKEKFQDINSDAAALISKARTDLEEDLAVLEEKYREFRMSSPLISRGREGADIYTSRYEELAAEYSQLAIQIDQARGRLELVKSSLQEFGDAPAHSLQKLALIDERNAERLGVLVTVERGKAESAAFQAMQPERMAGATAEYNSLLTMKTRLSQLRTDFGPEYPEAKALETQIDEMQAFLDKRSIALMVNEDDVQLTPDDVMAAYVSMLEHDLRALERQSQDTQSQMELAEQEAKTLVSFILQDEQITRDRTRHEDLYNTVVERLRGINLQKDAMTIVQQVIDSPELGEKVEPKASMAAALTIVGSLLIGGLAISWCEFRDLRIHSTEELEHLLHARVLGHVYNFERNTEVRKLGRALRKSNSKASQYLVAHHLPASRVSESFRAIRTQVLFALGSENQTIGVTSAGSGAGKSTIAANFSVSLATAGHDTLLIDCDMRLPQVHAIFGIANGQGLSEAIQGNESIEKLFIPSDTDNLTLITAGQLPTNPSELLGSPQFKALLAELKNKFAYVVLDCPPVLPVSDPTVIAPLVDGLLFVSVIDGESKPQTKRAEKILRGVGGNILGCVVNRVDDAGTAYGYTAYGYENAAAKDNYFPAR